MINLISDWKVLSEMIESFKSQGYDQIRLSGGTSKDGSLFTGIIPVKYDTISKKTYFVVVPYNSKYYLDGESNINKRSDETHEQTGLRELFEETGIIATKEKLILVWENMVPDNRKWKKNEYHKKQVYVIDEFDESNYFSYKVPNPINAETLAPICISVDLLIKVIFPGHRDAVRNAIEKLILKNLDYLNSLRDLSY